MRMRIGDGLRIWADVMSDVREVEPVEVEDEGEAAAEGEGEVDEMWIGGDVTSTRSTEGVRRRGKWEWTAVCL